MASSKASSTGQVKSTAKAKKKLCRCGHDQHAGVCGAVIHAADISGEGDTGTVEMQCACPAFTELDNPPLGLDEPVVEIGTARINAGVIETWAGDHWKTLVLPS